MSATEDFLLEKTKNQSKEISALKSRVEALEKAAAPKEPEAAAPAVLPDGSACFTTSTALPKDHWVYRDYEAKSGCIFNMCFSSSLSRPPGDLVRPFLREAVRRTTNYGKITDIDPDAMVQNLIIALYGNGPPPQAPPKPPEAAAPVLYRDWPEDFEFENGKHTNYCCECTRLFTGLKGRTVCKKCVSDKVAALKTAQPTPVTKTNIKFKIGASVRVIAEGAYKGVIGTVAEWNGTLYRVKIPVRNKLHILWLPADALELHAEGAVASFTLHLRHERIFNAFVNVLREQVRAAQEAEAYARSKGDLT